MYFKNTKRYRRLTRLRKKTKKYTNKKKKVHFGGGCGASTATSTLRQVVYEDDLYPIERLKQNDTGRGTGRGRHRHRHRPISLDDAICGDFNFMYDFHRNLIVYTPYNSTRVVPSLGKKFVISNNYACEIGLENYDQLPSAPDTKHEYESLLGNILHKNQMNENGSIVSEFANIHYDMISLPDKMHTPLVVDSLGLISSVHPSCAHVTEGISPEEVNVFCKHVLMNPDEYPMYDGAMHRGYGMLTIEDIRTIISRLSSVPEPYSDRGSGSDSDSERGSRRLLASRRP